MISNSKEVKAYLYLMLSRERETAEVFARAEERTGDPKLKKLFKELEQCARNHHAWLLEIMEEREKHGGKESPWVGNLLLLELENHDLYNRGMALIADPAVRQMFQQLREEKMRNITLLQEELRPQEKK